MRSESRELPSARIGVLGWPTRGSRLLGEATIHDGRQSRELAVPGRIAQSGRRQNSDAGLGLGAEATVHRNDGGSLLLRVPRRSADPARLRDTGFAELVLVLVLVPVPLSGGVRRLAGKAEGLLPIPWLSRKRPYFQHPQLPKPDEGSTTG